ncbi:MULTISPECIES: threonine dehydratase [Calothrix]|uniref:Threonine dehydratase n=2 Tax=Calothrix TaxID=1186 RepID=A0ABR8A8U2_9CYAN|nr:MULTISPECIES: threonine dehydratase [Calothrix]MBD2196336.1 threonine dehydratase [Calothrix parietina FACHB-288]MBD2225268.1 threonine dehydratase [Calothrix anomala FACHB-343]
MFRLTQIMRNFYLRLEGVFSVIFRSVGNFFQSFFGFFAKLFGFSESGYFLESDQAQTIKRSETPQLTEPKQDTPTLTPASKRRANAKMDYYLNMARDIKKN